MTRGCNRKVNQYLRKGWYNETRTYVDRIVCTRDLCHQTDSALLLWREAADGESTAEIALCLSLVRVARQARNRESVALDSQSRRFADTFESHLALTTQ